MTKQDIDYAIQEWLDWLDAVGISTTLNSETPFQDRVGEIDKLKETLAEWAGLVETQCIAVTTDGSRCKRLTSKRDKRCFQHTKIKK